MTRERTISRTPRGLALLATIGLATLASRAVASDAKAIALSDQALLHDYLRLDFRAASRKLNKAVRLCGKKSRCSPEVHARVLRDLAVVYITGQRRKTRGRKLLVRALKIDPRLTLDSDFTTPALVETFRKAQQAAHIEPTPLSVEEASVSSPAPEMKAPPEVNSVAAPVLGSEDCPPDFPGCEAVPPPSPPEDPFLDTDSAEKQPARQWLGVSLQQDFLMLSGESGVCLSSAPDGLSCYRAGGDYREPSDLTGLDSAAVEGGSTEGGLKAATTRLLISYERQMILPALRLGGALGYAVGGGPAEPEGAAFVPYHVELHGHYDLPSGSLPFSPFASLALGIAQVDASVLTDVVDRNPNPAPGESLVATSRVTVWKKTGTTFTSFGAGARYELTQTGTLLASAKVQLLFPSTGAGLLLQLGYSHQL